MDLRNQLKRKQNIIIRQAKTEFCYKEWKFIRKEITDGKCPFGFKKFIPEKCRHCRYYGEWILDSKEVKE